MVECPDDYSLGPFDERLERLLEELNGELLRKWKALRAEPPELLWHYTDAEGFRSIVTFETLRFSHSRLMNDATEHAFGWSRVSEVLDRETARHDRLEDFFGMTRAVGSEVHGNYNYFIFCFSERADSLSQWRAYGSAGAGYALGFQARELNVERLEGEFFFVKLIYDLQQQAALIEDAILETRQFFSMLFGGAVPDPHKLGILHRANVILAQHLMRLAYLFKHPSFEDEREWRLIVGYSEESGAKDLTMLANVQFRSSSGLVRPFFDFNFATKEVDGRKSLPLAELMYGPTLRPAATAFSVDFFLARRGYGHLRVAKSNVPLEG
jgi:hypothetical protein